MLHARPAVATIITKLIVSLARFRPAVEAFSQTDAVLNLAQRFRDVSDASSPWESATRALRGGLMRAIALLLPTSCGAVESVAQCLPQLVQAARLGHGTLQRMACAVIVLLTSAPVVDAALDVAARLPDLQLPVPLGRAAAARSDSQNAGDSALSPADLLLRLRSAVMPPLVDQMRAGVRYRTVPRMLHAVISNDEVLARAAADTSALEQLAAIVVSEVRTSRWRNLRRLRSQSPLSACGAAQAELLGAGSEDAMALDAAATSCVAATDVLHAAFQCIELLCSCSSPDTPGATNATAVLWERHRAAVCTPAAIAAMCRCLAHPDATVRLAVAKSLRVLARSQDAFTQETLGDGQLAEALVLALRGDEATSVEVCLAISNFVTTPSSPARQQFFDKVRCPAHSAPDPAVPRACTRT